MKRAPQQASVTHSPIRVTKHGQQGQIIAEATVYSLAQARAFLDGLAPDGTIISREALAIALPLGAMQRLPVQQQQGHWDSTDPEDALLRNLPHDAIGLKREICPYCAGRSAATLDDWCGACAGTGEIAIGLKREICPYCAGRSAATLDDWCGACAGTGEITVEVDS